MQINMYFEMHNIVSAMEAAGAMAGARTLATLIHAQQAPPSRQV